MVSLRSIRRHVTTASAVAALVACASGLEAQSGTARNFRAGVHTAIGYTGVLPEAQIGAGVLQFFGNRGIGVFADWKMTFGSIDGDEEHCPPAIETCSVTWALANRNDLSLGAYSEWLVFNAGAVYALTQEFAVVLGAGMARKTRYQEYLHEAEPEERITNSGRYFVYDEPGREWVAQAVGGLLLRAGPRLAFRVGYETAPGGMSVGGYFVIR
jgi:hypothetical protein